LLLATRGRPRDVFMGAAAAFVVQSLFSVFFGSLLGLLPRLVVRFVAGGLFLLFALLMWRRGQFEEEEEKVDAAKAKRKTIVTAFVVIFVAEWGDLTQFATATLEARSLSPVTIFLGATTALWLVAALAIYVGRHSRKRVRPQILQGVAAAAFAVIGVLVLLGVLG
ncbi:MAG: TMEM165/GDT1 family protein, partial [Thermoplasmatota archaeon]